MAGITATGQLKASLAAKFKGIAVKYDRSGLTVVSGSRCYAGALL
jgi:hypothetical protein